VYFVRYSSNMLCLTQFCQNKDVGKAETCS
jgi:hypothetical protein